jgi:hypothetical protein
VNTLTLGRSVIQHRHQLFVPKPTTRGVNEMVSVRNAPTAEEILADMKEEDESLPHVRHDKDWERRTWIYGFLRAGLTEFYIHGKRYVIT